MEESEDPPNPIRDLPFPTKILPMMVKNEVVLFRLTTCICGECGDKNDTLSITYGHWCHQWIELGQWMHLCKKPF